MKKNIQTEELRFFAYWVYPTWFLDVQNLENFLKVVQFKSLTALCKELNKYGHHDVGQGSLYPTELNKKLSRAFQYNLVFENCQGHESTIFPDVGPETCKPTSTSFSHFVIKKAPGGASLSVRALAEWSGIPLAKCMRPEWLAPWCAATSERSETRTVSAKVPHVIATKKLQNAIDGVLENWHDIPVICLCDNIFSDMELMPDSTEETTLTFELMSLQSRTSSN